MSDACADIEGQGVRIPHLENHKCLKISLDILVRTPYEKQLDPSCLIASQGRFVRAFVKYVDD